jgi:hypothetical protein
MVIWLFIRVVLPFTSIPKKGEYFHVREKPCDYTAVNIKAGMFTQTLYLSAAILTIMCAYGVSFHITYTGSFGSVDIPANIALSGTTIIR